MVELPVEIKKKIYLFLDELKGSDIPIEKAYVFGSYAKGTSNEWSDVDLAIVSDKFVGDRHTDKNTIRKFKAKVDYVLSPLPFRPEDFTEDDLFVKEIIKTGIRII